MSTTSKPLKYLWMAVFENGHIISQPADDKYSKHDDTAEWNPSAFRDIQEYTKSPISMFVLGSYHVSLKLGLFRNDPESCYSLEQEPLTNRKLIYYREMEQTFTDSGANEPNVIRYCLGYEGINSQGKVEKKVIFVE